MAKLTKEQIVKLQKTLKTDEAIGKSVGISRQAVHQLRVKYGIEYNVGKNKERNEKVLSLFKKGKSASEISKELDISISQVYRIRDAK